MTEVTATLHRISTTVEVKLDGAPEVRNRRRYSRTVAPNLMEIHAAGGDVWGVTVTGPIPARRGNSNAYWSWPDDRDMPGWVKEIVIAQATAAGLHLSRLDDRNVV